jgi:hypothetical protein
MCAAMLWGYLDVAKSKRCDLRVSSPDRDEATRLLVRWYGKRTTPRKTGKAAIDRMLGELGGARDRLCACRLKDVDCVERERVQADAVVDRLLDQATGQRLALDDGLVIHGEAMRCAQQIEIGFPMPK